MFLNPLIFRFLFFQLLFKIWLIFQINKIVIEALFDKNL